MGNDTEDSDDFQNPPQPLHNTITVLLSSVLSTVCITLGAARSRITASLIRRTAFASVVCPVLISFRSNACTKADSHIACRAHAVSMPCPCHAHAMPIPCPCRAHAVPLPCRAANGLECVFSHLIYTVRPCLIHTCHSMPMPRPCHVLTMPFFSRPLHSTAVERRPVGYLPAFSFFRLPRGVPRRLLSEAYQSLQLSIPTTVKSGSSTLQKRRCVKLLD